MAENQEDRSREDLTEEASPHRLEEYRQKGIVAQSRDITTLVVLLATSVTAFVLTPKAGIQIADFMREVFRTDLSARIDLGGMHVAGGYLMKALKIGMVLGLPVCLAGFIFGILSSLVQVGPLFTVEPLSPDFSKIDPIQGFKRIFSAKMLIDGVRLIAKLAVALAVSYFCLKSEVLKAPGHWGAEPGYFFYQFSSGAKAVFIPLTIVFALFAAIDFGFQKFEYDKNLRMTKQEAKQEHKEREGDPQIRARIRSAQREMARRRMMQAVRKADVIVTNPTHIAVAIVYENSKMSAPKVVAKGADYIAQKMKQVAADAGVPLVENVPLARTLYKTVKVGQSIPRVLYQAVAEVLAHVYRLRRNRF